MTYTNLIVDLKMRCTGDVFIPFLYTLASCTIPACQIRHFCIFLPKVFFKLLKNKVVKNNHLKIIIIIRKGLPFFFDIFSFPIFFFQMVIFNNFKGALGTKIHKCLIWQWVVIQVAPMSPFKVLRHKWKCGIRLRS